MNPTVVLLHGVGLDHTMWQPVLEAFGERYETVTPDLLGHGTSAPAPSGTTLDDLVDAVLDDIPSGSHLVGFSLGALVAQQVALRHPDRLASVVSVSSVCRRTDEERLAVARRLKNAQSDYAASMEASVRRWFDGSEVSECWIDWTRKTLAGNDIQSFLNCYRVFATGDAEVGPRLGDITAPALAITGSDDPGSTPDMSHRLANAIPGCTAVIVGNARHMLPVERPTELAHALIQFIGGRDHV